MTLQERAKRQADLIAKRERLADTLIPFDKNCAIIEGIYINYTPLYNEDGRMHEGPIQKAKLMRGENEVFDKLLEEAVRDAVTAVISPRMQELQSEIDNLENQ